MVKPGQAIPNLAGVSGPIVSNTNGISVEAVTTPII